MRVSDEETDPISKIAAALHCPQDCPCATSSCSTPGRVECVGDTGLLECREKRANYCLRGMPFGGAIFCTCPLRKYLAKASGA